MQASTAVTKVVSPEPSNNLLMLQSWAFSLKQKDAAFQSVDAFLFALGVLYDDPDAATYASAHLCALKQGHRTAEEYSVEFRQWVTASDWNDSVHQCIVASTGFC